MKVTFKTGSEANYGSTNGEIFFASNTKQLLLNGVKYIPKKLSELTNDSGFLTSITKSMVENVLTGTISSHTHTFASLTYKPTSLEEYGFTDAMRFYTTDAVSYVAARFNNSSLTQKAANSYIEFWGGGGWFNLMAGKFITKGGTSAQFLKGDGSLDSNTYALASDLSKYLPLTGGTLSGSLTCNGSYINMNGAKGAKGYRGYFNNSQSADRAAGSHIFQSSGWAYGTNAISLGAAAYAGIRNTDSDSETYPYLHWQWMNCLQVQETTSGTAVNCYGAILTNAGGNKDTATFSLCIGNMCVAYGGTNNSEELNNFLSFTNTNASYGRVVVYIADNKSGDGNERIFAGTTSRPRSQSNVKIGNVLLGQECIITDVASKSVNGVMIHRVAFFFWNKTLPATYDITKETTAIVCTKVNNTNYSGASSYASGSSSVASGYSSVASGYYSVASGSSSVASGSYSVASGSSSVASGSYSVASGYYSVASGSSSVASGYSSVASGYSSVASGYSSVASGYYSVASGYSSVASGSYSVASGYYSVASGSSSVASGSYSVAKHEGSKVYAMRGVSGRAYQTVLGRDNVEISAASVVVGWGTNDAARKNIFVLDTAGNATFGDGGAATVTATTFNGNLNGSASKLSSHIITDLVYRTIYVSNATGILIKTDVVATRDTMVNVHIWGNSYFKLSPIDTYIQFYNYNSENGIISQGCTHLGYNFGDVYAFIYNSLVYIWFDVTGTGYPTINAFVGTNSDGGTYNHLTSITSGSKPTSGVTREVVITPKVNAFTDSNVATATKLQTQRKITVGSKSLSFDGSADISFALDEIITNTSHINLGSINVNDGLTSYNVTINNHLELGTNADVSGLTPSKIGAAAASHTHQYAASPSINGAATWLYGKYTGSGGKQNPNYFGTLRVGALMMNTVVNGNTHYKDWIISDCYTGNDAGGAVAFGVNRQSLGAYIMRSAAERTEWAESAELLGTHNYTNYAATKDHTHLYAGSASAGGAATSAVKLNTSRKLWGHSFDGSADVYGNIYLYSSNIEVATTRGIREFPLSGFIGFVNPSIGDTDNFSGICLGWANNPTSADASLRINSSTFAYKGNTVWHGGNLKLGYTSSGLSRAVQKDSSNNLYVVAPSLFEQGISNNYPKNLRWITEDEGQLAFDTEVTAGTTSTVQVSIPVANGISKGFMKSISTVTDVTGYTPCPVKSGTPYYKLDAIELDYTDFLESGSGSIESHLPLSTSIPNGGELEYILNYAVDSLPRLLTINSGGSMRYLFWLHYTDDESSLVALYHCIYNDLWLVIDGTVREIRITQGGF